jgi:hypothetical protein
VVYVTEKLKVFLPKTKHFLPRTTISAVIFSLRDTESEKKTDRWTVRISRCVVSGPMRALMNATRQKLPIFPELFPYILVDSP